jgi:hypothetical protein
MSRRARESAPAAWERGRQWWGYPEPRRRVRGPRVAPLVTD